MKCMSNEAYTRILDKYDQIINSMLKERDQDRARRLGYACLQLSRWFSNHGPAWKMAVIKACAVEELALELPEGDKRDRLMTAAEILHAYSIANRQD